MKQVTWDRNLKYSLNPRRIDPQANSSRDIGHLGQGKCRAGASVDVESFVFLMGVAPRWNHYDVVLQTWNTRQSIFAEPTQLVLVLRHSYRLWEKWVEIGSYGGILDEER